MRISVRPLVRSTSLLCLVAGLAVPEAAATNTPVTVSYQGSIASISSAMSTVTGVVAGDGISGSFEYNSSQTGTTGSGTALYTFTGTTQAKNLHTFSLQLFNSPGVGGTQVYSDTFTGNSSGSADYFVMQLTYSSSGTTLQIIGDTTANQSFPYTHANGHTDYELTLTDKNNAGGYTSTNLPLPTSSTIKDFIATSATLHYDPPNFTFDANINEFNGQVVPEPSSLLMGTLALLIGTAATFVLRVSGQGNRCGFGQS
jgi:hypothetical protein